MLKIRMQRTGRINSPSYRIVVVEHTSSPTAGKFVEKVGTYNPKSKERNLNIERVKYWMSVGAKPSDTVHNMLVSLGALNAKKINVLPKFTEKKPEAAPAVEGATAPAPAEGGSASGGKEEAAEAVAEAPVPSSA
jgi:small subunit ribosomal protein S16